MPAPATYFYQYLENQLQEKDALILFTLYSDIRYYLRLCSDQADYVKLQEQAAEIFQEYIVKGAPYPITYNEIIEELRQGYDADTGYIDFPLDEDLFQALYIFVLEGLDQYYLKF